MGEIRHWLRNLFFGLFSFALFFEWMAPLTHLTDTGRIDIFLISFALWLIIDMFRLPVWLRLILKSLVLFIVIDRFFLATNGSLWSFMSLGDVWGEFRSSWNGLLSGEWMGLSPLIRTTFFLSFVWMTASIMYRQVVLMKHIFWIWMLTVIYVCVLDSLTPFDGGASIVRVICYGFIALSVSRLHQLSLLAKKVNGKYARHWVLFTGLLLSVVLAVSYSLPKYEASWEPIVSLSFGTGSLGTIGEAKKVGYGENDASLGGGFVQDDTPVFVSRVTRPYYWRGEAKDEYDGKGWFHSEEKHEPIETSASIPPLFTQLETEAVDQETSFVTRRYSTLFTAGQVTDIDHEQTEPAVQFETLVDESGLRTVNGERLQHYRILTELPLLNEQRLRESSDAYPEHILGKYLQLPDLPTRVHELAQSIVRGHDNPYDKVKAVETYLKTSFVYETEHVPQPPSNRDFVDHFLFDIERGYCDHFSTAMVVLLRSNGIPARWVKGFAPGESVYDSDSNTYTVTVKNSDAHSWVEVYFEGIGWLPFEPTPSFVNPTPLDSNDVAQEETSTVDEEPRPEEDGTEEQTVVDDESRAEIRNGARSSVHGKGLVFSLVVASLLFIGLMGWIVHVRGGLLHAIKRTQSGNRRTGIDEESYRQLMTVLERRFGERRDDQTMREYVMGIDGVGEKTRRALIEWTKAYEASRYSIHGKQAGSEKLAYWWSKVWDELSS